MKENKLPKWNLESIYPSVESEEFNSDLAFAYKEAEKLVELSKNSSTPIIDILHTYDTLLSYAINLSAYAQAAFTVDTTNPVLIGAIGRVEKLETTATNAVSAMTFALKDREDEFSSPELKDYELFLNEIKESASHMMSLEEESIASEMLTVSSSAWSRLQESVTSGIKDGDKTLTQLRGLAMSDNRDVRRDAYEREIKILRANETALAASLNGVKGTTLLLEKRRGWSDPIDRSLFSSRISHKALDALISALEESLPLFREYMGIKAQLLGLEKMEWYDIFAPVGKADMSFTWEEAKKIVIDSYSAFSPEVGAFIKNAFDNNWIDPESHDGKVGGAYDTAFPLKKESRVMMNWEGSFDSVSTLSHELGHAYHDSVVKDLPISQAEYPMTLAETASIFGETVIFNEVMKTATKDQQLTLIEQMVQSACQVCVDILSRYKFEKYAFEARKNGEVTAQEYCSLMLKAQEETYGDGIGLKHPYMWAVKSHYYSEGFSFYNYPYAFGQLFALGLYASKDSIPDFPEHYKKVLSMTGKYSAKDVAAAAGCDIEDKEFWLKGIRYIGTYIEKMKEWL